MTTSRQITANDVAWPNIVALDLDPTGANDNSAALTAHINAAISAAAIYRYQQINIYIPAGKYKFLSQIVKRSYISIISLGMVVLDFSASSSLNGLGCIRDYNDAATLPPPPTPPPAPTINSAANRRVGLNGDNGVIEIIAPANALACLDVGQAVHDSTNSVNYREVTPCRNVYTSGGLYGMVIREKDTYMLTVEKTKLTGTMGAVRFGFTDGLPNENSGEKIVFTDCVFVAFTPQGVGLDFYCNDWGVFISNSSIDFMFGMAAQINTGVQGVHLHYTLCHFEKCVDYGLIVSHSFDSETNDDPVSQNSVLQNSVTIDNCFLLPSNRDKDDGFTDAPVSGTRVKDGLPISRAPLLQGPMAVSFTNNRIQGYYVSGSGGNKDEGVYFCDDNILVVAWSGNTFYGFPQSISGSRVVNLNSLFDRAAVGSSLIDNLTPGWLVSSYSKLTAQIVTTQLWENSKASLQISAAPNATLTDWINIEGDLIPWDNQPLASELILWAGGTAGSIAITWTFEMWGRKAKQPNSGMSITRNSTTATVTTTLPHGLESGEVINMYGATQAAYNTRAIITTIFDTTNPPPYPPSTQFSYPVVGAPASPATGALEYTIEQGGLTLLPAPPPPNGVAYTQSVSTIIANGSDPLNSPEVGRNRWIRMPISARLDSNNVVPGTQFVRPKIFITKMSANDTIFIGAMQVLRS